MKKILYLFLLLIIGQVSADWASDLWTGFNHGTDYYTSYGETSGYYSVYGIIDYSSCQGSPISYDAGPLYDRYCYVTFNSTFTVCGEIRNSVCNYSGIGGTIYWYVPQEGVSTDLRGNYTARMPLHGLSVSEGSECYYTGENNKTAKLNVRYQLAMNTTAFNLTTAPVKIEYYPLGGNYDNNSYFADNTLDYDKRLYCSEGGCTTNIIQRSRIASDTVESYGCNTSITTTTITTTTSITTTTIPICNLYVNTNYQNGSMASYVNVDLIGFNGYEISNYSGLGGVAVFNGIPYQNYYIFGSKVNEGYERYLYDVIYNCFPYYMYLVKTPSINNYNISTYVLYTNKTGIENYQVRYYTCNTEAENLESYYKNNPSGCNLLRDTYYLTDNNGYVRIENNSIDNDGILIKVSRDLIDDNSKYKTVKFSDYNTKDITVNITYMIEEQNFYTYCFQFKNQTNDILTGVEFIFKYLGQEIPLISPSETELICFNTSKVNYPFTLEAYKDGYNGKIDSGIFNSPSYMIYTMTLTRPTISLNKYNITGKVLDTDGNEVSDILVTINYMMFKDYTNNSGNYQFINIAEGIYNLGIESSYYRLAIPITINLNKNIEKNITVENKSMGEIQVIDIKIFVRAIEYDESGIRYETIINYPQCKLTPIGLSTINVNGDENGICLFRSIQLDSIPKIELYKDGYTFISENIYIDKSEFYLYMFPEIEGIKECSITGYAYYLNNTIWTFIPDLNVMLYDEANYKITTTYTGHSEENYGQYKFNVECNKNYIIKAEYDNLYDEDKVTVGVKGDNVPSELRFTIESTRDKALFNDFLNAFRDIWPIITMLPMLFVFYILFLLLKGIRDSSK